jgi:MFS family permease
LIGLALQALSIVLLLISPRIEVLLVARALQGLSTTIVYSVGLAILVDTVGVEQIGRQAGYFLSSANFGVLISPMLGGYIYHRAGYYAVVFMMLGLVVLDILLRIIMIEKKEALKWGTQIYQDDEQQPILQDGRDYGTVSEIEGPESPTIDSNGNHLNSTCHPLKTGEMAQKLPPFLRLLTSPRAFAALFAISVGYCILAAFDAGLAVFVKQQFHWESSSAGLIFLGIALPSFLSPVAGHYSDRFGPRWIVVGGFLTTVAGLFAIGFISTPEVWQVIWLCNLLIVIGSFSPNYAVLVISRYTAMLIGEQVLELPSSSLA